MVTHLILVVALTKCQQATIQNNEQLLGLTNRFHVAVHLLSNRSQMTSKDRNLLSSWKRSWTIIIIIIIIITIIIIVVVVVVIIIINYY